jgi:hypothetical protein
MADRKDTQKHSVERPEHFFQKELVGEAPPSFATMQTLYHLATDLFARRPWNLIAEDELVLVEEAASKELCFCSVMGALGQVRALQVYLGPEGYHFLRKLQSGQAITVGEFFATQRSVSVEIVRLGELTGSDRKFLEAMGHPLKRGTLAPIFRAIRPGYHPWYVTEGEAGILAQCQRALIKICDHLQANPELHYWDKENVYPTLSRQGDEEDEQGYRISLVEAPSSPVPMPNLPTLDEARIQRIRDCRYPSQGVLEVDHFYGAGMVGEANQRKACFRVGLAIDAKSGLAYPPEVSLPASSTGDVLTRVVLQAVESARVLPREIRVRDGEFKALLDPLAQALGVSVGIKKSLPALEFAKKQLLEMMGDPGPFLPR